MQGENHGQLNGTTCSRDSVYHISLTLQRYERKSLAVTSAQTGTLRQNSSRSLWISKVTGLVVVRTFSSLAPPAAPRETDGGVPIVVVVGPTTEGSVCWVLGLPMKAGRGRPAVSMPLLTSATWAWRRGEEPVIRDKTGVGRNDEVRTTRLDRSVLESIALLGMIDRRGCDV